jgi:hypothetical protein
MTCVWPELTRKRSRPSLTTTPDHNEVGQRPTRVDQERDAAAGHGEHQIVRALAVDDRRQLGGESGKGRRGLAVAERQLSPRPSAEALRRDELPRATSPLPAAAVPTVTPPMPRHTSRTRPSRSRRVHRSPSEDHSLRAGTPRIVRAGPFQPQRCFASSYAGRAYGARLTPESLPAQRA